MWSAIRARWFGTAANEASPASIDRPALQYGVVAYRPSEKHGVEIMLITSRETKRWVIPRGNPIRGLPPHLSAAREAYEEAGLIGHIGETPVGQYVYAKRLKKGVLRDRQVVVFALCVTTQLQTWAERHERTTRWFTRKKAAASVEEHELRDLLLRFEPPPRSDEH